MRAERQIFLRDMVGHDPVFPNLIYSSGSDRRAESGRLNTLSVIFNLDWPANIEGEVLESIPKTAVASAIFRVKDYLERHLMAAISLLDIRSGCVKVRYIIPDDVDSGTVKTAVKSLIEERDIFSVMSVNAHVHGRAIRL